MKKTSRYLSAHAAALPATVPFVGPEALERKIGHRFKARLGANESGFGPSPKAIAAMQTAVGENWKYADPENFELREAIAAYHGIGMENVNIGEGIDGLLGLTLALTLSPGETVVTSQGAYPTFNFHVAGHGGRLVKVPYSDDRENIGALLDTARREKAKILYVSNPDNPMGSWWPAATIEDLIVNLPEETLLILDEAYCDTAPAGTTPPIDVSNPQVLRFRTFSKAYGMAGARIGYVMGDEALATAFDKVRNHYGINRLGQVCALAALRDQDYLKDAVARIARARERICDIARQCGLAPLRSATNFVAVDCGRDDVFARRILEATLSRDVFIRMPGVAPLNRCIRISTGPDAELDLLATVLPEAVTAARGMA
ncbi:MAG: pyridoxal phosphate-dependent aminotransferase [Alphaproteobacteria bacterium]|nr:pyridoxal phosphate-dependent aminotransferase [Alphaproteobacteria bacterium]